jgi:hypothetical protein
MALVGIRPAHRPISGLRLIKISAPGTGLFRSARSRTLSIGHTPIHTNFNSSIGLNQTLTQSNFRQ